MNNPVNQQYPDNYVWQVISKHPNIENNITDEIEHVSLQELKNPSEPSEGNKTQEKIDISEERLFDYLSPIFDVGDVIWYNNSEDLNSPNILQYTITQFTISKNKKGKISKKYFAVSGESKIDFYEDDVMKKIFNSKEECEDDYLNRLLQAEETLKAKEIESISKEEPDQPSEINSDVTSSANEL